MKNTDYTDDVASPIKKIVASRYKELKMKLTKRKAPRLPRDARFFNQIRNLGKSCDGHYFLIKLIDRGENITTIKK